MSKFQPRGKGELQKDAINPVADLADVNSRVTHRNGDGAVKVPTAGVRKSVESVVTICPHCHKTKEVEVAGVLKGRMQNLTCEHCAKSWSEDLSASKGLAKSSGRQSEEMASIRASISKLLTVVEGLIQKRASGRASAQAFVPGGVNKADVAETELSKARRNGWAVRFGIER